MDFISDKLIVQYVAENGGLCNTRHHQSKEEDFKRILDTDKTIMICITGTEQLLIFFFNTIYPNIKKDCILITIENDVLFERDNWVDHNKILKWVCWNKPSNNTKYISLPIGINHYRNEKSLKSVLNDYIPFEKNKKEKYLLCNWNNATNKELREPLMEHCKTLSFCDCTEYKFAENKKTMESNIEGEITYDITDPEFYVNLSKYKMVLSPLGTGFDCHRTWEALYLGVVPIVFNPCTINEMFTDLPVIFINNINTEFNKKWLDKKYKKIRYKYKDWLNNPLSLKKLNGSWWLNKHLNLQKIKYINYADHNYHNEQKINSLFARKYCTDMITEYSPFNIDKDFKSIHSNCLSIKKGGGLWLWKPYIILKELKELDDNDILMYIDSGAKVTKDIQPLIKYMNTNNLNMYSGEMINQVEIKWSKKELLHELDMDKNIHLLTPQRIGGFHIIRKNEFTLKFYQDYLDTCKQFNLINDTISNEEHIDFIEHRHDQSIFSLLCKKYDVPAWIDISHFQYEGNRPNVCGEELGIFIHGKTYKHQEQLVKDYLAV